MGTGGLRWGGEGCPGRPCAAAYTARFGTRKAIRFFGSGGGPFWGLKRRSAFFWLTGRSAFRRDPGSERQVDRGAAGWLCPGRPCRGVLFRFFGALAFAGRFRNSEAYAGRSRNSEAVYSGLCGALAFAGRSRNSTMESRPHTHISFIDFQ